MQIYEFLKVKKVKCVNANGLSLTKDKEYQLLGVTGSRSKIHDDDGYEIWVSMERFEPVPNNNMSKSDNTNPIFKLGDKVYKFGDYESAKEYFDSIYDKDKANKLLTKMFS